MWGFDTAPPEKPFKLYWKVTGSITGVLVAGFLLWFLYLELQGKKDKSKNDDEGT